MRSSTSKAKQKSPLGGARRSVSFEDEDDPFLSAKSTAKQSSDPPIIPRIPEFNRERLPKKLYATDCYPLNRRINTYSKPKYLIYLVDILDGTKELNYICASCFSPLFQLQVRKCSFTGKLVHQMLCRGLELWSLPLSERHIEVAATHQSEKSLLECPNR